MSLGVLRGKVGCFWDGEVVAAEAIGFLACYCAYVTVCAYWEVRGAHA